MTSGQHILDIVVWRAHIKAMRFLHSWRRCALIWALLAGHRCLFCAQINVWYCWSNSGDSLLCIFPRPISPIVCFDATRIAKNASSFGFVQREYCYGDNCMLYSQDFQGIWVVFIFFNAKPNGKLMNMPAVCKAMNFYWVENLQVRNRYLWLRAVIYKWIFI